MTDSASQIVARRSDDIDLIAIIVRLWKGRWWIISLTAISIAISLVVALRAQRVYQAQAIAAVASPDDAGATQRLGQIGGLAALAGINLGSNGDIEEALAIMRSREFSERFITEHGLLPGLFPEKWEAATKTWKGGAAKQPTLADAYSRLGQGVRTVSLDKKTNLVSVSIVWPDPQVAAQLANDLISRLNEEMRRRATVRTSASVKFLQEELERTSAIDTRQAINHLIESQIKQRMYANVTEEFALRVVDRALPPDAQHPIRPKKGLMLVIGALVGGISGCLLVLGMGLIREFRARIPQYS